VEGKLYRFGLDFIVLLVLLFLQKNIIGKVLLVFICRLE